MTTDYLNERIIPRKSLGRLSLGMGEAQIVSRLGAPLSKRGDKELVFFAYSGLEVCLHVGRCSMLIAEKGYSGTTPDGIGVGVKWKQLVKVHKNLKYHEEDSLWVVPGIHGLGFEIVRKLKPEEHPIHPPWVMEIYEVLDPNHAFVQAIYVLDSDY